MSTQSKRKHLAFPDIDLNAEGRQIGHLHFPHSPDDDAWGTTQVSIAVLKNGEGPTVLLEGGNHGDEYEGPIILGEIIRNLDLNDIRGRLVIVPTINQPAAAVGKRNSPIDGVNFNRAFPGDPHGTITQQIAAYVHDVLMPESDAYISLHSGGSSLDILPSSIVHTNDNAEVTQRNFAAASAFDAPISVLIDNLGDPRTAANAAMDLGVTAVSVEMAGQGTVSPEAIKICRRGVLNILGHFGVLSNRHVPRMRSPDELYQVPGAAAYVISNDDGVFEPLLSLGSQVVEGDLVGRVHFITDPTRPPQELFAKHSGIIYAKRQPGKVQPGNCCAVIAERYRG